MARYEQNNGGSRGPPSKRGRLDGREGSGGGSRSHARTGTWLPMEVEEELARCDPDQRPNHILLFTILNAQYTIDVSIIYKARVYILHTPHPPTIQARLGWRGGGWRYVPGEEQKYLKRK